MADENKKEKVVSEDTKKEKKLVEITLPLLEDPNAPQEEYFSVNFKGYRIKRGVTVKVPEELAEVIRNAEKGKVAALKYAQEKALREP